MKIKIGVLTPLHIGSGEEISPLEYLIDGNTFFRIDMDGLFSDPEFEPLKEKFIELAKNTRYIGSILPKSLLLKHILYSINIHPSAKNSNPIAVKSFIKSAGRVYIPGSSLKGSILSAILYKKAKEEKITEIKKDILNLIGKVSHSPLNNEFSRWLDITDSDFKLPSECLELVLAKVIGSKRGSSLPIFYEVIKPGTIFTTEIKTSLNSIYKFGKLSEEEILKSADEFYKKIYEKEKNSKLSQLLPSIPEDGFLLRLGQGSTCLSTSFLILAEELGIKDYKVHRPKIRGRKLPPIKPGEEPSTRKLISGNIPLGWIEVSYA